MNEDYYNDSRFIDIGDLPTGFTPYDFKEVYIRPFIVKELVLLHQGSNQALSGIMHIIRAVNMAISCDVTQLTDGDFYYVMAWLRLHSYPKVPNQVHWTCRKPIVVEQSNELNLEFDFFEAPDRELKLRNLVRKPCNNKNVEIVHNASMKVHSLDDSDLHIPYDDIDYPRVATLNDFVVVCTEYPHDKYEASIARWLKEGDTLAEKRQLLNKAPLETYHRILECKERFFHGISEVMTLKCRVCRNQVTHTAYPEVKTFFAANSEQNVLDMQYTLLSELKMQPDDTMPAKALLYYYSSLAKDKQKEQERENLRKAIRRKAR